MAGGLVGMSLYWDSCCLLDINLLLATKCFGAFLGKKISVLWIFSNLSQNLLDSVLVIECPAILCRIRLPK